MPRPSSYAVFCLKKKTAPADLGGRGGEPGVVRLGRRAGLPHDDRAVPRRAPRAGREDPALPPRLSRARPFFFNVTASAEIYTLSLHDALPILAVLLLLLLVAPCLNCLEAVKKPPPVAFKVMCLLPITIL